jgi:hypothetical protein
MTDRQAGRRRPRWPAVRRLAARELARGLRPPASGLLPDSVAVGGRSPQDPAFPLALFGDAVTTRRCYLSATEAFSTAGAPVRLRVQLARRGTGKPLLTWVYQGGDQWRPLGQSTAAAEAVSAGEVGFRDGTQGLTRDGDITFVAPQDWARSVHRTRSGHWLRIDVEGRGTRRRR